MTAALSKYLLEIHENNYSQNECYEAYRVSDVINNARRVRRTSEVPREIPLIACPIDGIDGVAIFIKREIPGTRHAAVSRRII
jgi:hypothetical protein